MFGGAAGYRPRVRSVYYERVYVHSPEGHPVHSRVQRALQAAGASGGDFFERGKKERTA